MWARCPHSSPFLGEAMLLPGGESHHPSCKQQGPQAPSEGTQLDTLHTEREARDSQSAKGGLHTAGILAKYKEELPAYQLENLPFFLQRSVTNPYGSYPEKQGPSEDREMDSVAVFSLGNTCMCIPGAGVLLIARCPGHTPDQ